MLNQEQVEKTIYKSIKFTKTFPATGTFEAHSAACKFLKERGYDVGSMQRGAPIGIAKDADISKWRNLGPDVRNLDGVMVSDDFREGSVTIYLAQEIKE